MTTVEKRLTSLEARVSDIENSHGESIYQLERRTTRIDLNLQKILAHMGVVPTTEKEVDAELDQR